MRRGTRKREPRRSVVNCYAPVFHRLIFLEGQCTVDSSSSRRIRSDFRKKLVIRLNSPCSFFVDTINSVLVRVNVGQPAQASSPVFKHELRRLRHTSTVSVGMISGKEHDFKGRIRGSAELTTPGCP